MRPGTPARGANANLMTRTVDEAAQALSAAREYDEYALVINAMPMQAALRACEQVDPTCSRCARVRPPVYHPHASLLRSLSVGLPLTCLCVCSGGDHAL